MNRLKELFRAALIGFATLLVLGTFLTAEIKGPNGLDKTTEVLATEADERTRMLFLIGLFGAILGCATSLLLRLFPVGPKTKVAFGVVIAPLLPIVFFARQTFEGGKPADLAGMALIAAIGGLFVGLLEAARVPRPERPSERL